MRLGGTGTGGSNSVKLTASQIPSLSGKTNSTGNHTHGIQTSWVDQSPWDGVMRATVRGGQICGTNPAGEHEHTVTIANDNQQFVSITPKYVSVYAWKRTA